MEKDVEIGIFGGTGIYDSGLLENPQEIEINTPYGKPSDKITVGVFKGRKIAFLPRHGWVSGGSWLKNRERNRCSVLQQGVASFGE